MKIWTYLFKPPGHLYKLAAWVFISQALLVAGLGWLVARLCRPKNMLKANGARFPAMFANHQAIMLLIEPASGRIVDANRAAERFYGYTRARLCTLNIADINTLPPEKVALEREQASQAAKTHFVFPHHLANGEVRTVEVYASPARLQGQTFLFSIIHDITERRQAEIALQESEQQYSQLVEQVTDGIMVLDKEGVVRYVNPAAEVLFGRTAAEILDQAFGAPVIAGRSTIIDIWRLDGSTGLAELRATKIEWRGKPVFLATLHDITEQKQLESAQQALIADLQEALARVKQLSGLLPICASCKKIRDDRGYWHQVEVYIHNHAEVEFSHSLCPDCKHELYPRAQYPYLYDAE